MSERPVSYAIDYEVKVVYPDRDDVNRSIKPNVWQSVVFGEDSLKKIIIVEDDPPIDQCPFNMTSPFFARHIPIYFS